MRKIALVCFLIILGLKAYNQETNVKRTQFFPKEEIKPDELPGKSDVWIFIMAGQSNMAGRGLVEPQDTLPSGRVLTINGKGEVIVAKEPLHFYEPNLTGLDCGLSFGKSLIGYLPEPISVLIIPAAVGGSTISQWAGDSVHRNVPLMTNFMEKIELGKKYGQIKGILWHQGEGDANQNDIPLYSERLSGLFIKFRKIAGKEDLPVLIGELGTFSENHENWMKINEQIRWYSSTDKNSGVIQTSDLEDKGDKIHFNSEGQRIMGQRFAVEYITSFNPKK